MGMFVKKIKGMDQVAQKWGGGGGGGVKPLPLRDPCIINTDARMT